MINGKWAHILCKGFYFSQFTLLKFSDFENQSVKVFYKGSSHIGHINKKNEENIFVHGEPQLFEWENNALDYDMSI